MGKSDIKSKNLMQNNRYFADTINNGLFRGERYVLPEDLTELDTSEMVIIEDELNKNQYLQKFRDVLKQAIIRKDGKAIYVIIGIENQTEVNYAMPVRSLLYDAMRYSKQVENTARKHKEERLRSGKVKSIAKSEFLSGCYKNDILMPVLTLTVFYSHKKWDGARSIHEMFSKDIDKELLELIPDYKINILEPYNIKDWDKFESDIGILFRLISLFNKKEETEKLIKENPEKYRRVDNSVIEAINHYVKTNIKIDEESEETDMETAWEYSMNKAKNEGLLEGRQEGKEEGILLGYSKLVTLYNWLKLMGRENEAEEMMKEENAALREKLLEEYDKITK